MAKTGISNNFTKIFQSLTYNHPLWQVWQDFCTITACAIANAVDKEYFAARENLYMHTIERYSKDEQALFPQMIAEVTIELENNPDQDFLGHTYMALGLGNHWKGQFFTPYNVSRAMAQLQIDAAKQEIENKGWASVNDCACGGGAMLIGFANVCKDAGINYHNHVLFIGQDLDPVTAMMCYIQLSLLGCAGYVKIGDSLRDPVTANEQGGENIWKTPMYFSDVWHWRRLFDHGRQGD